MDGGEKTKSKKSTGAHRESPAFWKQEHQMKNVVTKGRGVATRRAYQIHERHLRREQYMRTLNLGLIFFPSLFLAEDEHMRAVFAENTHARCARSLLYMSSFKH